MHREVGRFAAEKDIDVIVCTGTLCKEMAEAAKEVSNGKKVLYFENCPAFLLKSACLISACCNLGYKRTGVIGVRNTIITGRSSVTDTFSRCYELIAIGGS